MNLNTQGQTLNIIDSPIMARKKSPLEGFYCQNPEIFLFVVWGSLYQHHCLRHSIIIYTHSSVWTKVGIVHDLSFIKLLYNSLIQVTILLNTLRLRLHSMCSVKNFWFQMSKKSVTL